MSPPSKPTATRATVSPFFPFFSARPLSLRMLVFGTQGAYGHSLPRTAVVQFARQVSAANYHIVSCGARALFSVPASWSPLIEAAAAAQLRGAVNFEVWMRLRITFAPSPVASRWDLRRNRDAIRIVGDAKIHFHFYLEKIKASKESRSCINFHYRISKSVLNLLKFCIYIRMCLYFLKKSGKTGDCQIDCRYPDLYMFVSL